MQEELKDIRNQGFESQVWNEGEKETLKQMVDNPDSFFVMTAKGYGDSRISIIPVLNHSFSVRCFQQLVAQFGRIYLYGAGRIGQRVWTCLKLMDAADKVKGFIVSEAEKNPEDVYKRQFLLWYRYIMYKNIYLIVWIVFCLKREWCLKLFA